MMNLTIEKRVYPQFSWARFV
ncbi:MAG: hypothetical protein RL739_1948, partial [Pseudomonadota bacterium]